MNKLIYTNRCRSLWIFALLLCISSCKKNPVAAQTKAVTEVRPAGVALTETLTESIGPDGGSVKSEDGRIEIIIPGGALTEETDIGIQVIKNTAISGIGNSYRFTPHGKIFKKKVTVRFYYKNSEARLCNKEALEIAYQNERGIWTCAGGTVNDTTQKIVSVQTDHFSDWALIASLELTPTAKTVGLGENVTLKALRYVYPPGNNGPDDLAVPLAIPDAICGVPTKLDPGYIVKWTLNGPGKLTANGNEASYTAPSTMPANRRVTVTAELNVQGKQVLLVSTIYIIDEGISISIDYGDWHTYPAVGVKTVSPNRYGIVSQRVTPDIPQIIISWPVISGQNSAGMHEWFSKGEPENYIGFEDSDASINGIYTSVYEKDDELTDSGGYVTAEEFTEGGKKYVRGSFIISQSGLMDVSTGKQREIGFVVGTYKVQRKW